MMHGCRMHAPPPIVLGRLILSQPGGQIMPTTLLLDPRIFRTSLGPVICVVFYDKNRRQQDKDSMISNIKINLKIANLVHHDMFFRALVRGGLRGPNVPPIRDIEPRTRAAPKIGRAVWCNLGAMHHLNAPIGTNLGSKFQFLKLTLHFVADQEHFTICFL